MKVVYDSYTCHMVDIAIESPRQADILTLLGDGDAAALALYPAENYYGLDVAALERPDTVLLVARSEGVALGTAALVDNGDGTAELKRMFVSPAARGLGIASALLLAVEARAVALGASTLRLETGHPQVAAIALYEKHGFAHIPQFGKYVGDPTSVCMEKLL
jgi:GNAT superfamily N-acetyltransferase